MRRIAIHPLGESSGVGSNDGSSGGCNRRSSSGCIQGSSSGTGRGSGSSSGSGHRSSGDSSDGGGSSSSADAGGWQTHVVRESWVLAHHAQPLRQTEVEELLQHSGGSNERE